MPGDPALVIWNYVEEWTSAQSNPSSSNMFNVTYLSWLRPPANCLKLNIDGMRSSSSGKIGAGGVLRDHAGNWIFGYQINLGVGEVLYAEAWGLLFGLKLVAKFYCSDLEVESDSAVLVQLMQKRSFELHPLGSLLSACSSFMLKMPNVKLSHIFRECNMVADSLAKCSITHDLGLVTFNSPPVHAVQAYLDDFDGVVRARRAGVCSSS